MKSKSYFLLLLFVAFLATPTVVNLLKTDGDTVVVAILEEENTQDVQLTVKQDFEPQDGDGQTVLKALKNKKAVQAHDSTYSSIFLDPVSPPPRFS